MSIVRVSGKRTELPAGIAAGYLVAGVLGVVVSDVVLSIIVGGGDRYVRLDAVKDAVFVVVTAGALFFHLRWAMGRIDRAEDAVSRRQERDGLLSGVLHAFNGRILRGEPLEENLKYLCGQLVDAFGFVLVWVSRKDPDGSIPPLAAAGPGLGFVSEAKMRWDDTPGGAGPVGEAIRTGSTRLADVDHPECSGLREAALRNGIRSAAILPLGTGGTTTGALSVCSSRSDAFSADYLSFLGHFADEVALSVADAVKQEQLALQRAALEAASNAVVLCARDGTIRWVNPAFEALTGWTAAEAVGKTPRILKSGAHADAFYRAMWEQVTRGQTWSGEVINRRKDGTQFLEEQTITPVKDAMGAVTHFISIKQDVSARKQQEAEIRRLSLADPLTGLPNRRSLHQKLDEAVTRARSGQASALVLLDIDNFRAVNETLGHAAGDQVLATLGRILSGALPPGGFLARVEGDEFGILLPDATVVEARQFAAILRAALERFRKEMLTGPLDVSFSAGVAPVDGTRDVAGTYALADAALTSAREQGTGRLIVRRTGRETESGAVVASRWGLRIRQALAEGRFVLAFQPVIRLADGGLSHFETLTRMRGEDGEELPPDRWLPTAEKLGVMPQVDRWALRATLDVLERGPEDVRLFTNLSGKTLGESDLLAEIEAEVARLRLAPGRLGFEITETAAVLDLASTREWIGRLKVLGCRFALDDFGIGFSSFSYLRALSVDLVKVDGSFVRNLRTDPTGRALILAVKAVSREMGMEVVAESVESEEIADALRALGVEYGQGFFWAAPLERPVYPVPS